MSVFVMGFFAWFMIQVQPVQCLETEDTDAVILELELQDVNNLSPYNLGNMNNNCGMAKGASFARSYMDSETR